jgi:hypothetical protein
MTYGSLGTDLHIVKDLQRKNLGSLILKDLGNGRVTTHFGARGVYSFVNRSQEKSDGGKRIMQFGVSRLVGPV